MKINPNILEDVFDKSRNNEKAIEESFKCGCFYCCQIFEANKINPNIPENWIHRGEKTALCPLCGIDSVLAESDVHLTQELLDIMHEKYFGDIYPLKPKFRAENKHNPNGYGQHTCDHRCHDPDNGHHAWPSPPERDPGPCKCPQCLKEQSESTKS